ncbi:MAG: phosphopantetheine-binding protein [Pseudomonadota bacterium]
MQQSEFRSFVLTFLCEARPDLSAQINSLQDDEDMFEAGVVDSHAFIGLCLAIEDQTGTPIEIAELDPDEFSSIQGLMLVSGLVLS